MIYRFDKLFKWTSGKAIEPSEGTIPIYGSNGIIGYTDKPIFNNKIILGRVGAYCGSVEYCNGDFNATDNTLITTCDETKILYNYAYYLLKYYKLNYYAGGAAQPLITQGILKHLKCDIDDIPKQRKISKILDNYDKYISNITQLISHYDELIMNIYRQWFIFYNIPDYKIDSFKTIKPKNWSLNGEENISIPYNWNYDKLNKIGGFKRGKNITAEEMIDGEIPVISAGIEPSGYHNKPNVIGKSLTISASGANAGYLKYNISDIWAADCSYYQDDDNIWFVYCSLKYLQEVINNMRVGAAQPHVYPKNINNINIIIPEELLINKFNTLADPIFEKIKNLIETKKELEKQRDLLLPRLMSGRLNIE